MRTAAAAKYAAAREKDLRYTRDLWEAGMLNPDTLAGRIRTIRIEPPEKREHVEALVRRQHRLHGTGRRLRAPGVRARARADEAIAQRTPMPGSRAAPDAARSKPEDEHG